MMESNEMAFEDPYDDTDYDGFNKKYLAQNNEEHKLERYEDRKLETAFSTQTRKEILAGKVTTLWRGINCIKDPCTLVILQHLLWDVKPQTIIEFGANAGGSAFYVADLMKIYGQKTHVYSMDLDLELLSPLAKEKREDITFIQGDCKKVEEVFQKELLKNLPHPWFVMDDAHVNTFGILDYFDQFLQQGDYLLIEDLDPCVPNSSFTLDYNGAWGDKKERQLAAFMKKHSEKYRVDKRYTDFFGYNGSFNWNGFIKRI